MATHASAQRADEQHDDDGDDDDDEHDQRDRRQPTEVGRVQVSPKSRSDAKNSSRNRTIWTTKPETESITPADIASVGRTPKRWKKRTLMATRAAVLGIARLT